MAGTPLATAFVRVRPQVDTASFKKETEAGIAKAGLGQSGMTAGKTFLGGFSKSLLSIGGLMTAAFTLKAGVSVFSSMIADAREAQRVARITASTITATGGAAGVTAKQVAALADALMYKTGADDEVIASGANMLLTFKNVRNEAGANNDIFSRSVGVLADMTAALNGGDLSSESMRKTAIQLGKALNDPVTGMTALRRVGVTFSAQQVDQVKKMIAANDVLGAQKLILGELSSEFGGTAAAAADPLQRMSLWFRELGENIGIWALPYLTRLTGWITGTAVPAFQGWWQQFGPKVMDLLKTFGTGLAGILRFAAGLPGPLKAAGLAIIGVGVAMQIAQSAAGVFGLIATAVVLAVGLIIRNWGTIWPAIKSVIDWIRGAWDTMVQALRNSFAWVVGVILGFIGSIIDGVARAFGWIPGIGPKLRQAAAEFEAFRDRVTNAIRGIPEYKTITITAQFIAAGQLSSTYRSQVPLGYQHGGWITEPVIGLGTRTGRPYTFAEAGPEKVTPAGGQSDEARLLAQLVADQKALPARLAHAVHSALSGVGRAAVVGGKFG